MKVFPIYGSSFVTVITISLVAAQPLVWLGRDRKRLIPVLLALAVMVVSSWLIFGLVVMYIYPQATGKSRIIENILNDLSSLFESRQASSNPYAEAGSSTSIWADPRAYMPISLFRWVLFGGSGLTWLVLMFQTLRNLPKTPLHRLLLLALYGGFGCLMALAVPVDLIGRYGSNLNVRLYVYCALFAAPLPVLGAAAVVRAADGVAPRPLLTLVLWSAATFFARAAFSKRP